MLLCLDEGFKNTEINNYENTPISEQYPITNSLNNEQEPKPNSIDFEQQPFINSITNEPYISDYDINSIAMNTQNNNMPIDESINDSLPINTSINNIPVNNNITIPVNNNSVYTNNNIPINASINNNNILVNNNNVPINTSINNNVHVNTPINASQNTPINASQNTPINASQNNNINNFEPADNFDLNYIGTDLNNAFSVPLTQTASSDVIDFKKQNMDNFNARDFLPKEINDEWFQTDFSLAKYQLNDDQLINSDKYIIGINTVGQSLKNATYDLRGTIPNPKYIVSPWNNSTYEPDFNLKPLC